MQIQIHSPISFQQQQRFINNGIPVKEELSEFIREIESRAIVLFHSPDIPPITIRDACQKIGILYYIRPEFHAKGVTLLSYFDLRSATNAIKTLPIELGESVSAYFSIMLHGPSNNIEEFKLILRNLPTTINEKELESVFGRYGEVRSIERKQFSELYQDSHNAQTATTSVTTNGTVSDSISSSVTQQSPIYVVEYFNIQDARLAAQELCATSSQIWGNEANVSFAPLLLPKQTLCRQLLGILSRWRTESQMMIQQQQQLLQQPQPMQLPMQPGYIPNLSNSNYITSNNYYYPNGNIQQQQQQSVDPTRQYAPNGYHPQQQLQQQMYIPNNPQTQMNYQNIRNNPQYVQQQQQQPPHHQQQQQMGIGRGPISIQQQQQLQLQQQQYYPSNRQSYNSNDFQNQPQQHQHQQHNGYDNRPNHHTSNANVPTGYAINRKPKVIGMNNPSDAEFSLDLNRLENGSEVRTTVMVRLLLFCVVSE